MDLPTRAAKLAEIWKQLSWLEAQVAASGPGPYLLGDDQLTLADLTWFPTFCVHGVYAPESIRLAGDFQPDCGHAIPLAGSLVRVAIQTPFLGWIF